MKPTVADRERTLTQPATTTGIEEAILYAKTAGYLRSISVDRGDRVRAGQVLAVIESPELVQQRDQAQAQVRQADATAQGAQAGVARAEADAREAEAGVGRARADVRQAEAEITRRRAEVAHAEAMQPRAQAQLEEAEAGVRLAMEQESQVRVEYQRAALQVRTADANRRGAVAAVRKADADQSNHQLTYGRLKRIQDQDAGLVAAQEVDVARARLEGAAAEQVVARERVAAAQAELETAMSGREAAERAVAVAAERRSAAESRVKAARQDLEVYRREVESARTQVAVAEAARDSLRSQVGVTQARVGGLQRQVAVAAAGRRSAQEQTAGARAHRAAADTLAGYSRIVAPFDGVVVERMADPGALVQNAANNQAATRGVVKVVRDDILRVLVPVPEASLAYVRRGQAAKITLDALAGQTVVGSVTRFAPAVDPRSRTMQVEIDLPNPDRRLRPGMYARVALTLEVHRGALSIPAEAIQGKEAERFVYVVRDGTARKTPITVGLEDGKATEVLDGLSPNDEVVVVGRDTLTDGARVRTEPVEKK